MATIVLLVFVRDAARRLFPAKLVLVVLLPMSPRAGDTRTTLIQGMFFSQSVRGVPGPRPGAGPATRESLAPNPAPSFRGLGGHVPPPKGRGVLPWQPMLCAVAAA